MAGRELQDGRTLKRANPKTIHDKILVGYQGWFTCAGDGEPLGPGHHGWLHWFNSPIPTGGRPNVDIWPDVSEYSPSELYPAPGLKTADGDQVFLFSSRHPKTVQRHFHWMALHGVDGAFLQRFAGETDMESGNKGIRNLRDEIGDRVREAAEAQGRVYAIMYDVSGVSADKIKDVLERDWVHLLHDRGLLDSPNYLHEKGKPVIALWGFGFNGRNHTPELVRSIADFFRSSTPGGAYLVAGVPGHWRTSSGDADRNPDFVRMWTECFDTISPWTIGRYETEEDADRWGEVRVKADADYLKKLEEEGGRKVDYMPVVFPGGSGYNLSRGKWGMNNIPRNGGRFLWKQLYNARRAGVRTIYGAMWDEYDEGTAIMPVVTHVSQLPLHPSYKFVALDVDGHDLPSDWYMRIVGFAAEAFRGERTLLDTFPVKELQDYWATRPHCEDINDEEERQRQRQLEEVTRTFRAWEVSEGNAGALNDAPPPPYSLEGPPLVREIEPPSAEQASTSQGASSGSNSDSVLSPPGQQYTPGWGQGSLTARPGEIVLSPPTFPVATPNPSSSSSSTRSPPPRHPSTSPLPSMNHAPTPSSSALPPPPRHPTRGPAVNLTSHPHRSGTPSTRNDLSSVGERMSATAGASIHAPPLPHPHRNSSASVPPLPSHTTSVPLQVQSPVATYSNIHSPFPTALQSREDYISGGEYAQRGRERAWEHQRRSSSSSSRERNSFQNHRRPSSNSHMPSSLSPTSSQSYSSSSQVMSFPSHGPYTPGHPHQPHTTRPSSSSHISMPQPHGSSAGAYSAHYYSEPVGAYAMPGQGHTYDQPQSYSHPHELSHSGSASHLHAHAHPSLHRPPSPHNPAAPYASYAPHAHAHAHAHGSLNHAAYPTHTGAPMMSMGPSSSTTYNHPQASSFSPYHPPYSSGPGPGARYGENLGGPSGPGGMAMGGGGTSPGGSGGLGGVASTTIMNTLAGALVAVESIAGKDKRKQLEKKMKNTLGRFT